MHSAVGVKPNMGKPIDRRLVAAYAGAFKQQEVLSSRGFSVLVNISGNLFKASLPSLKDVEGNTEAGKTSSLERRF